jgi:hypothetical protein
MEVRVKLLTNVERDIIRSYLAWLSTHIIERINAGADVMVEEEPILFDGGLQVGTRFQIEVRRDPSQP